MLPAGRKLAPGAGPDRETFDPVEILHRDGDAREWTGVVTARHGLVDCGGLRAGAIRVEDDVGAEIACFVTADRVFDQLESRFFTASHAGGRLPDGFSFHGVYAWQPAEHVMIALRHVKYSVGFWASRSRTVS